MLVSHRTLLLQMPHEHIYEMRVLDDDGDFLEHVLEANARLLQPGETQAFRVTNQTLGKYTPPFNIYSIYCAKIVGKHASVPPMMLF